jgi:hypothetical protein
MIDCLLCGAELPGSRPATPGQAYEPNWYHDEDRLKCEDCGATNHVSVDEDGEAYVSSYDCVHGKGDAEACDVCEIEHGGGVGEAGT